MKRRRLTSEDSVRLDSDIIKHSMTGMTAARVSELLGVSRSLVVDRIAKLMRDGRMPRVRERRGLPPIMTRSWAGDTGRVLGSMHDIIEPLSQSQRTWLAKHTPPGKTTAAFIADLICSRVNEEGDDS